MNAVVPVAEAWGLPRHRESSMMMLPFQVSPTVYQNDLLGAAPCLTRQKIVPMWYVLCVLSRMLWPTVTMPPTAGLGEKPPGYVDQCGSSPAGGLRSVNEDVTACS
jgi:hypothetical protein